MKVDNISVGNRIKSIRKNLGITLEEFGILTDNAHKSLVSKWEKGQSLPNNKRLKIISEIGNLSVDELLYGSENINKLKIGLDFYNYLLDYYDENSHTGKALRFFNENDRDELILIGIDKILNSQIFRNHIKSIEDIENQYGLSIYIESTFKEEYINKVKTNSNLIISNIESISDIIYQVENYDLYEKYGDVHNEEYNLIVILEKIELGVCGELKEELINILLKAKSEIEELTKKYRDDELNPSIKFGIPVPINSDLKPVEKYLKLPKTVEELNKYELDKKIEINIESTINEYVSINNLNNKEV